MHEDVRLNYGPSLFRKKQNGLHKQSNTQFTQTCTTSHSKRGRENQIKTQRLDSPTRRVSMYMVYTRDGYIPAGPFVFQWDIGSAAQEGGGITDLHAHEILQGEKNNRFATSTRLSVQMGRKQGLCRE